MHCVFSYDLAADGDILRELESTISSILTPYRHVRRLQSFYIIHVDNVEAWNTLLRELTSYLQPRPERAHFILSPPMEGGMYNGLLGSNEWEEINEITRM